MVAGPGLVGLSADTWLGVNKETSWGTKVGPSVATEFFLFLAESLKADRPLVDVPIISAAHRDVTQTFIGAQVVNGDVELACTYDSLQNILLHCFGEINNAASGASGSFTRDFDLADQGRWQSATSPGLSIHLSKGVVGSGAFNPTVFSYEGCIVDAFEFSCGRDQPLKLKVTLFGKQESLSVYSTAPTFPTAPVINWTECTVSWGGTEIPVTDFTLSVKRNLDKDRVFAGDIFTSQPPMGQYEVTCALTTEWDGEKRVGTATLRDDYLNRQNRALLFDFLSTNTITGTSIKYRWQLQMPAAIISAFPVNVAGRGRVTVPMTFTAYDSDVTTAPHELRLTTIDARNFADN